MTRHARADAAAQLTIVAAGDVLPHLPVLSSTSTPTPTPTPTPTEAAPVVVARTTG
ncbi:MAG TPA: hypothetical protein VF413_04750 [Cellulomonas sp.]